jgi:hypothetical protein
LAGWGVLQESGEERFRPRLSRIAFNGNLGMFLEEIIESCGGVRIRREAAAFPILESAQGNRETGMAEESAGIRLAELIGSSPLFEELNDGRKIFSHR